MSKKTILVVDDYEIMIIATTMLLKKEGYETLEARSGDEAANILRSGAHVDLLLTDWKMPGELDGVGLSQLARKKRPTLPIILWSSDDSLEAPIIEGPFIRTSKSLYLGELDGLVRSLLGQG